MRIRPHLWAGVFVLLAPLAALAEPEGMCNPISAISGSVTGAPMVCAGCHGLPISGIKVCLERVASNQLKVTVEGGGTEAGFNLAVIGGTLTPDANSKACAPNEVTHKAPTAGGWTLGYSPPPGQPVLFFLAGNAGPILGNMWNLTAGAVPDSGKACSQ